MRNKLFHLAIITLAMTLTSCGIFKKNTLPDTTTTTTTPTTTVTEDPLETVISTLGNWRTMQTGGNIKLSAGSSFSSAILIITADSLYAVDKVHKRYIAEKVSILTSGIPVTVSDVQDMFLGRPFILGKGTLDESLKGEVTVSESNPLALSANESYKGYGYVFNFDKAGRIASLQIIPTGKTTAAYQIKYGNVRNTSAGNIAHDINANATVEKKKIDFSLNYKNIEWNSAVKIDKGIPGNYSRMSARDLFSMFSN